MAGSVIGLAGHRAQAIAFLIGARAGAGEAPRPSRKLEELLARFA